jgi:lipoprotein-releasing system permease protein
MTMSSGIIPRQIVTIAFRQLFERKKQAILIISGIGVGVMVLVTAMSLMNGILSSFTEKIVNNSPHIVLTGEHVHPPVADMLRPPAGTADHILFLKNTERQDKEVIKNYLMKVNQIKSDRRIVTVSPVVFVSTILSFGTLSLAAPVIGVVSREADAIQHFSSNMLSGRFEDLDRTPDGVMIGSALARELTVQMGDRIQCVGSAGDRFTVRVLGVFSTGINEVDNCVYANIPLVQTIGGFARDEVTGLQLRVGNLEDNTAIAAATANRTNQVATTWEQNAAGILGLLKMISSIVYLLVFFVIVVAGFGVSNILITNVLEKFRDIAIMKSLGFRRNEIIMMYLLQGFAVALIGAAIGCLLGFVMIEIFRSIPVTPSQSGMLRSDRLQMGMSLWYFILASGFSCVVCVGASVGPARKAARLNPVDILRGER